MPAWGSNRLWCENCPRAVVLGTYRRAEAARTGPRILGEQQRWCKVESDPTRVRRSGLLAQGGAGHAEKALGQPFAFLTRAASSFRKNWQGVDAQGIKA